MSENIRQLYSKSWDKFEEKVRNLAPNKNSAEVLVKELSRNKGWRERVSAAKIISAYDLKEYIPDLITSFELAPEYYTCCAFTTMIKKVYGKKGIEYLQRMNNCCSNDERGQVLKNVVSEVLAEYEKA